MCAREFSEQTVYKLWQIIRPKNEEFARQLLGLLDFLAIQDKDKWYHDSFLKEKKSGLFRRITPAREDLAIVQWYLVGWMKKCFVLGQDYIFQGVLPAVRAHQGAVAALKIDLHSAYDYVSVSKLRFHIKLTLPDIEPDVLDFLIALLTFDGSTPQGCSSTAFAFNILAARLDKTLKITLAKNPVHALTRFADDILISFVTLSGVNKKKLTTQLTAVIAGSGFRVGKTEWFESPPFIYLGTEISGDNLLLVDAKYGEIIREIEAALADPMPSSHRAKITGLLTWATYISGDKMPREIIMAFWSYYERVGKHPKTLLELLNKRLE